MNKMISNNKTPEADNQHNETRAAMKAKHDMTGTNLKQRLQYHVTGAIERGEKTAIVEQRAAPAQAKHKKQQFDFKADLTKEAPAGKSFKDVAQAQHSPLPHLKETFRPRMDVVLDKMRANIVPELSMCIIAEHYDKIEAHAQRLADALVWIIGDDTSNEPSIVEGREALTEWSKSI